MSEKQKSPEETLDAQLEKIRLESVELSKNISLMGYVCGNTEEFKKVKEKILGIWRLMRGDVQIYERGHGWFECVFRDPHLLKRVWNSRPYHVMGHLLLLKPWRVDFSTKLEDTNVSDLWISQPSHDGVKLIIEENGLGKFIKFDRASGGFFARACVNIDIAKHGPGYVRISDNIDHPLLLVWFEDFSHGCWNCGDLNHLYKACPLRKFNHKKVSITIVRKDASPSVVSSPSTEEVEEGWTLVTNVKKKGVIDAGPSTLGLSLPSNAISGQGGGLHRAAAEPAKLGVGEDNFSSPISSFKEGSKGAEDTYEDMETMLEMDDLRRDDLLNLQKEKEFIEELGKELAGESPIELLKKTTNNEANNSNSGSLKRRGEDDGGDDTASSSLKRQKTVGDP